MLSEAIVTETLAVAECAAAVQDAETDCNAKKEVRNHAMVEFEAAQKDQEGGEAALVKANEAVTELCPQLEQATAQSEFAKTKLGDFESGPLASFVTYKTKTAAPIEAAQAGA